MKKLLLALTLVISFNASAVDIVVSMPSKMGADDIVSIKVHDDNTVWGKHAKSFSIGEYCGKVVGKKVNPTHKAKGDSPAAHFCRAVNATVTKALNK